MPKPSIKKFCDDCFWFRPITKANPKQVRCRLDHTMQFHAPKGIDQMVDQNWGYYRTDCKDHVSGQSAKH